MDRSGHARDAITRLGASPSGRRRGTEADLSPLRGVVGDRAAEKLLDPGLAPLAEQRRRQGGWTGVHPNGSVPAPARRAAAASEARRRLLWRHRLGWPRRSPGDWPRNLRVRKGRGGVRSLRTAGRSSSRADRATPRSARYCARPLDCLSCSRCWGSAKWALRRGSAHEPSCTRRHLPWRRTR